MTTHEGSEPASEISLPDVRLITISASIDDEGNYAEFAVDVEGFGDIEACAVLEMIADQMRAEAAETYPITVTMDDEDDDD